MQHRTPLTPSGKFGWWKMIILAAVAIVTVAIIASVNGAEVTKGMLPTADITDAVQQAIKSGDLDIRL